MYVAIRRAHERAVGAGQRAARRLAQSAGQGTVEYVGLVLLVSLLMLGVIAVLKGHSIGQGKELGELIVTKIKEAVEKVQY